MQQLKRSMVSRMKCEEPFPEADVGDDSQQPRAPFTISEVEALVGAIEQPLDWKVCVR
jgi:hypothetical protein